MPLIDRAGMQVSLRIHSTSGLRRWSNSRIRPHEPYLPLHIAKGEGPRAISTAYGVPEPSVFVDCADMQIPLGIDGARHTGCWSDAGIRANLPCLSLHVAKRKGPIAVGQPNGVPQSAIRVDCADMQIALAIDCARHSWRWSDAGVRADFPCLGLYVAECEGPAPVGQPNGVPESAILIDRT